MHTEFRVTFVGTNTTHFMVLIVDRIKSGRLRLWITLCAMLIVASGITRVALLIRSIAEIDLTFVIIMRIFFTGFVYDFVNAVYFGLPLVLYLWLTPDRLFLLPRHRFIIYAWYFVFSFVLLLNATAEWLFWDEFNVRFNFIAVDYLLYTTEVVGNIEDNNIFKN